MTTAVSTPRAGAPGSRSGPCTAERHTASNDAWNKGCRCGPAMQAHERHIADRRRERLAVRAASVGACAAKLHGTQHAYDRFSCRCPEALRVKSQSKSRTEGRAFTQWNRWRGPRTRVSRTGLMMLFAGYPDSPNRHELMVADIRLSRTPVVDGPRTHRTLETGEIAKRLGITENRVRALRTLRARLASGRTERRLADARWKALRASRAPARRASEEQRHAAGHEASRQRREAWRVYCKQIALLRESITREEWMVGG